MKPKENHWSKKRPFHFQIGLTLSLAIVLTAFEWKSYGPEEIVSIPYEYNQDEALILPPVTEQKIEPPKPKKIKAPVIEEVPDEEIIAEEFEIDTEFSEDDLVPEDIDIEVEEKVEEVIDEIFTVVEEGATPQGGLSAFYSYLGKKVKYPKQAKRMGIEGKVFVQFVVEKDGSLSDIEILRGVGGGCDEEAMRVIQLAPKWNPGKQRGRAVRQRMIIPINFSLN